MYLQIIGYLGRSLSDTADMHGNVYTTDLMTDSKRDWNSAYLCYNTNRTYPMSTSSKFTRVSSTSSITHQNIICESPPHYETRQHPYDASNLGSDICIHLKLISVHYRISSDNWPRATHIYKTNSILVATVTVHDRHHLYVSVNDTNVHYRIRPATWPCVTNTYKTNSAFITTVVMYFRYHLYASVNCTMRDSSEDRLLLPFFLSLNRFKEHHGWTPETKSLQNSRKVWGYLVIFAITQIAETSPVMLRSSKPTSVECGIDISSDMVHRCVLSVTSRNLSDYGNMLKPLGVDRYNHTCICIPYAILHKEQSIGIYSQCDWFCFGLRAYHTFGVDDLCIVILMSGCNSPRLYIHTNATLPDVRICHLIVINVISQCCSTDIYHVCSAIQPFNMYRHIFLAQLPPSAPLYFQIYVGHHSRPLETKSTRQTWEGVDVTICCEISTYAGSTLYKYNFMYQHLPDPPPGVQRTEISKAESSRCVFTNMVCDPVVSRVVWLLCTLDMLCAYIEDYKLNDRHNYYCTIVPTQRRAYIYSYGYNLECYCANVPAEGGRRNCITLTWLHTHDEDYFCLIHGNLCITITHDCLFRLSTLKFLYNFRFVGLTPHLREARSAGHPWGEMVRSDTTPYTPSTWYNPDVTWPQSPISSLGVLQVDASRVVMSRCVQSYTLYDSVDYGNLNMMNTKTCRLNHNSIHKGYNDVKCILSGYVRCKCMLVNECNPCVSILCVYKRTDGSFNNLIFKDACDIPTQCASCIGNSYLMMTYVRITNGAVWRNTEFSMFMSRTVHCPAYPIIYMQVSWRHLEVKSRTMAEGNAVPSIAYYHVMSTPYLDRTGIGQATLRPLRGRLHIYCYASGHRGIDASRYIVTIDGCNLLVRNTRDLYRSIICESFNIMHISGSLTQRHAALSSVHRAALLIQWANKAADTYIGILVDIACIASYVGYLAGSWHIGRFRFYYLNPEYEKSRHL